MANLWGISPTMARIHGLLFICGAALSMDDIMARLAISRGNVSMNLSKLIEWGLVRRVHKRGETLDFFSNTSLLQIVSLAILAHYRGHVALLPIDKVVQVAHVCAADFAT